MLEREYQLLFAKSRRTISLLTTQHSGVNAGHMAKRERIKKRDQRIGWWSRALGLTSVAVAFADAKIIRADQSSSLLCAQLTDMRSIRVFLIKRHEKHTRATTTTFYFSRRASRESLITLDPSWVTLNALKLGLLLSRSEMTLAVLRARLKVS